MENVMTMPNGFVEMNDNETSEVNGGAAWYAAAAKGAVYAATKVGAFCGMGPVGGAVVIGACVVAAGVAVYVAVNY